MKKQILLCLALLCAAYLVNAQSSSEKKAIAGTYTCDYISYGEYYNYSPGIGQFNPGEKLQRLIATEPDRLGKQFLESLRIEADQYARSSTLTLNTDLTYSLSMGKERKTGRYSFLPLKIEERPGSEDDISYNENHKNDLAFVQLDIMQTINFSKTDGRVSCRVGLNVTSAGEGFIFPFIIFIK